MAFASVSDGGRFVVIDELHLDREVFEVLARWAADRGLRIQDAVQLALCAFNEGNAARGEVVQPSALPPVPEQTR